MIYQKFLLCVNKIQEIIEKFRINNIQSHNVIFEFIELIHQEITNDLKELMISKPLLVNACIKSIHKSKI